MYVKGIFATRPGVVLLSVAACKFINRFAKNNRVVYIVVIFIGKK